MRIAVSDLRPGMYVSEPDCGWRNTPFFLEGLLIKEPDEIATLAEVTFQVTVDPNRSLPEAFTEAELDALTEQVNLAGVSATSGSLANDAITMEVAEPLPWWKRLFGRRHPEFREHVPGIADALMVEREPRFQAFVIDSFRGDLSARRASLRDRLRNAWAEWSASCARHLGMAETRRAPKAGRPAFVPDEMDLVIYRTPEPTATALPKAKAAYVQIEKTVERLVRDVHEHGISDPAAIKNAADMLVENMIVRPTTMMWLAKLRANNAVRYQQAVMVAVHLTALGRQIGFPREQLADLASIGLLLDMGKMAIAPELLDKPGPLDGDEADVVRGHVEKGLSMFAASGTLPPAVLRAIAEHHERVDGSGYPAHLTGADISIFGKMAAIADCFVAMINPRPYAPTLTAYDAIRELFKDVDAGLYGPLVEQFVQAIGIFPVGTLIELSSGEIAIVVQHNQTRRLEPKVLVLTDEDKTALDKPFEFDILKFNQSAELPVRIVRGVTEGTHGIDFRHYYLKQAGTES